MNKKRVNKWHRYLALTLHEKGIEVTLEEVAYEIKKLIKSHGTIPMRTKDIINYLYNVFRSINT